MKKFKKFYLYYYISSQIKLKEFHLGDSTSNYILIFFRFLKWWESISSVSVWYSPFMRSIY